MKARAVTLLILSAVILAGCGAAGTSLRPLAVPATEAAPTPCAPAPIVVPTPPATIPGYADLDETTGLHVTGSPPDVDLASYRLEVTGKVDQALSLSYDELRCMPRVESFCTLNCPGFFVDEATWAGASLDHVLALAGVHEDADRLRLISADGYAAVVYLAGLTPGEDFLAYEWEGEPLPILHGFPVRAVFPSQTGSKWVKWLVEIEVV